jgi:glucose-6-phosphate isomerase
MSGQGDPTEILAAARARMAAGGFDLRRAFADDPGRAGRLSVAAAGLHADFSKNLLDDGALAALVGAAQAAGLPEARRALFAGEVVNASEGRAALHPALRADPPPPWAARTLERMAAIATDWRGRVRHVVHIGIGGSALGPRLVCEALRPHADGPRARFAQSPDPQDLSEALEGCAPDATAFIVASKSFTTPEALSVARAARAWGPSAPVVAATGNADATRALGIAPDDILDIPAGVGGRFSLWGAVGLPVMAQNGPGAFADLLAGARAMDAHFLAAPLAANAPALLGLLSVWYRSAWGRGAAACFPYAHGLRALPAYLQQLMMESCGKAAGARGPTAPVVFGAPGPDAQHAIGQWLHQSPDWAPADFIVVADALAALPAAALAQAQGLMEGYAADDPARACPGGRPSTTIVLPRLDAFHLGALLALYEHAVFTASVVWGVNAFDQWGVELGKRLTGPVEAALSGGSTGGLDASTAALVKVVRDARH